MPAERFFIPSPLIPDAEIHLEGTEFHHLAHVMRLKEGDSAEIVNGNGVLAHAILTHKDKKRALFRIVSIQEKKKEARALILAQALPRINRLEFIIEKATEIGVTHFWLFPGHLSERKALTDHQLERLDNLIISAMKQCGRLFKPSLEIKNSLDQWPSLSHPAYFGDVREEAPSYFKLHQPKDDALFFIGPESGFSDKEEKILQKLGAQGVKLHSNTLRTDTAALVALSLMSQDSI